MQVKAALCAVFLMCLFVAIDVRAGGRVNWSFVRWGMSPEELVKASGGKVVPLADPGSYGPNVLDADKSAQITHTANQLFGRFYSKVEYGFSTTHKLAYAIVTPVEHSLCRNLESVLIAKYGTPEKSNLPDDDFLVLAWQDQTHGNLVRFFRYPCSVRYEPLVPVTDNGL